MGADRISGQLIELHDSTVRAGERVAVSLTHRSLTQAVLSLFGPAIVWALCLAFLPVLGPISEPVVLAAAGATGFAASLWLGHLLASSDFGAADVRLTPVDQADEKLEIVSGS
jgi:hypothetical protein